MKEPKVIKSITDHIRVYEMAGINPPIYRITYKENIEIYEYYKSVIIDKGDKFPLLKNLLGVDIEIVVPLI